MLIRIVRMTFKPEEVEKFLQLFEGVKEKIRGAEGCEHLELLQDADHPHIYVTISHWKDKESLNNYRHSELFRSTWEKTKVLFRDSPKAFSLVKKT